MAGSDDEMDVMTEDELRVVYKKLFDMRPMMTIDTLMEMLHRHNWDDTKCMAELYRLREGIEEDKQTRNMPIDPATEVPAMASPGGHVRKKISQEPTRSSPRRKPMSKGVFSGAASSSRNGRVRLRGNSSSPETDDDSTPQPDITLGHEDEDLHANKRRKVNTSSKTSMFSREQTNDSVDLDAKFAVIDRREVKKALQKSKVEKLEESDDDEEEKRHIAQIASDDKKATHTTVTPWIGRLAGGLYVKTLLVTDEFNNALKDKDGVVADMKKQGELKSLIDMTVNREKLWKEGWNGKHVTDDIRFIGESTWENATKTGYGTVAVDGEKIRVGDCVVIRPGEDEGAKNQKKKKADGEAAAQIWFGKVMSMFNDSSVRNRDDREQVHVRWFNHGGDSFLSETAGPRELFLLSRCDNIPLTTVAGKVHIHKIGKVGPVETDDRFHKINNYFYRFHDDESDNYPRCWEDASFHEDDPDSIVKFDGEQEPCYSCNKKAQAVADSLARTAKDRETDQINRLWWGGKQYRIGDFVYIQPDNLMKPFVVGRLKKIIPAPKRSKVRRVDGEMMMDDAYDIEVYGFRRQKEFAGDYFKDAMEYRQHRPRDERRLYQTAKVSKYDVERLTGKCNVVHGKTVEDLEAYKGLADTFYVLDHIPEVADDGTPNNGRYMEELLKPLGPADFKDSCDGNKMVNDDKARREEFAKAGRKLLAMDVFAGCGGLTHGLDGGGAVETRWAVEWDVEAAATFKKNFPHATMYNEDVNKMLHQARKEELGLKTRPLRDRNGKMMPRMPKRNQVDFLYGGPPCQDFSGANRFKKANSIKNSLLTVYLSLLDHYRPTHFMLENVKDLLYHRLGSSQASKHRVSGGIEQGSVKFILRALTSLGYSAQYNLMQAAELGSPQSRRRVFFMGTRLGVRLPLYPQPTHTCNTVATHTRNKGNSAPHGPVTIGDAISDLPQFDWGVVIPEDDTDWLKERAKHIKQAKYPLDRALLVGRMIQPYGQAPLSNYQTWMRQGEAPDAQVRNHYTSHFSEVNLLRVLGVPMVPLANWRDAPQEYIAEGLKQRGKTMSRYDNRYQRLDALSSFQTCLTNMDPGHMAVIHPFNRRVLTIRELARAQGFPDWFIWEDGLDEQGRKKGGKGRLMKPRACIKQIGNAVSGCHSLPLGKAIFEVEFERWVKEGKPIMEPRKLDIQLKVGQRIDFGDSDSDSTGSGILENSEDRFSNSDDFDAKDEINSDDELMVVGAQKAYKPDRNPSIILAKAGGNNTIVMSGSDSEGNHPPKRRPQGTFVHGHGRSGIANRRATNHKTLNKDELLARPTTDESSEDYGEEEDDGEEDDAELFVEQGIGAPPNDEMDDEEFERWLAIDGGRFDAQEAETRPRRLAEIAALERSFTPSESSKKASNGTGRKASFEKKEAKKPVVTIGAFVDDSDDEEMVVGDGMRKISSSTTASKQLAKENDVAKSAKKRMPASAEPAVKKVPVVKTPSFSARNDALGDEEESDVLVMSSKKSAKKTKQSKDNTPPTTLDEVEDKFPVLTNGNTDTSSPLEVEGDRDAAAMDVDGVDGVAQEEQMQMASALSDAMQGVEHDEEAVADAEGESSMDEGLKVKLANWDEVKA